MKNTCQTDLYFDILVYFYIFTLISVPKTCMHRIKAFPMLAPALFSEVAFQFTAVCCFPAQTFII